ncbi:hypothetical protein ACHAWO_002273 [Cyclotella atomus]|uniref:Uncharacterized protein n=1 Tax=Cyclotella atomus TaxID=382360 RepID=A0ABD3MS88_9STRA
MFAYPPIQPSFSNEATAFGPNHLPLVPVQTRALSCYSLEPPAAAPRPPKRSAQPMLIASISAGFEKGDFLVREEKGSNVYFDFFEEAFNFVCQKGYTQMPKHEEKEYMDIIKIAHKSVPGGCRFNTGRLLMVLKKNLVPIRVSTDDDEEPTGTVMGDGSLSYKKSEKVKRGRAKNKLNGSANTLPTDSDSNSSYSAASPVPSSAYSSASTSYADSWE